MLLLMFLFLLPASAGCRSQEQDRSRNPSRVLGHERDQTPPDEPRVLKGMFTISVNGSTQFTACHTRTRVPVARTGDYAALEKAYKKWRTKAGEQLLITVAGRIAVPRIKDGDSDPGKVDRDDEGTDGANGGGVQLEETPHLIIDHFKGIWPGETCGTPGAAAQLQDMYWKLTRLEGRPVMVRGSQREPHLVFHSQEQRLAGSGGCNRLQGSYALNGQGIVFSRIVATRMFCPGDQEQEEMFLSALERVVSWRIEGQHLELLDTDRTPILRLEERALTQ